ncbi:MAG: DUF1405 domain-containing protein [Candidatus Nanoarchaeia archaeon]|jgi:uncharacterized membrane protein YpjA
MIEDLLYLLVVVNLFGFINGSLFFYGSQLMATNPLLWVFVPDCPLAAFLFVLSASLLLLNKKANNTLFLLTVSAGIKYGLWTWIVITSYWGFYVTPDNLAINLINLAAHLLLIFEQLLLSLKFKFTKKSLLIVLSFLLLSDLSDYLLGTHPYLPDYSLSLMFPLTIGLTFGSLLIAYLVSKRSL